VNDYLRASVRFSWLLIPGLVIAMFVSLEVLYRLPSFKPRTHPSYSATELLLVDSSSRPYVRTAVSTPAAGSTSANSSSGASTTQPPDLKALVDAANLYPLLIQGDDVKRLRTRLYGPLPGTVQAAAIFSSKTAARFRPSAFPVIQITSTATGRKKAIRLARTTGTAFRRWLLTTQKQARVPARQRILIRELQAPEKAQLVSKPAYSFALLAGLAVALAFVAAAVVLDRLRPRVPERDVVVDVTHEEQPPVSTETRRSGGALR
jgi:hypothetical protein